MTGLFACISLISLLRIFLYLSKIFRNPLYMMFLFHSWYVILMLVQNMKIFCSGDLFWFQSYWSRDILHRSYFLCSQIVAYDWFPAIFHKSRRAPHVGQDMLSLSGTHEFTPFTEFMISPIRFYTLHNLSVLGLCLRINYSGLVWLLCLGLILLI